MNTPYIAEFRKSLSAAHRRKISNSLKRRNKGVDQEDKLGAGIDKGVLRITHLTNSANNATKAYYNVARGAKDFQLVRKYRDARRAAAIGPTRLQKLGAGLDSALVRGASASRIGSRIYGDKLRGQGLVAQIAARSRGLDLREKGLKSLISSRKKGLNIQRESLRLRGLGRQTSRWNRKSGSWIAQTLSELV